MKKRRIYTQSLPLTSCQEEDPPPGPGLCGPVLWLIFYQFGRTILEGI